MRTTLTIEDDIAGLRRRKARELDKPFKAVVNSALRKGLADEIDGSPETVVVRPHDFGASRRSDEGRFNQLADELEVEDYLRKAGQDVAS